MIWDRIKRFLWLLPAETLRKIAIALLLLLALYLPIGVLLTHKIDDDLNFATETPLDAGKSRTVAIAAALIERETGAYRWTPNDPFFLPGAWMDRMPAFQKGIVSALSRFAIALSDQIGRTRGSSQINPELDKAVGFLKYPPDVWMFAPSISLLPTPSSDRQYRVAMRALERYNNHLAAGEAIYERRSDNLQATLELIASDLGSASAAIASRIDERSWIDTGADAVFYDVKGRLYAYALLMKGLREDFATVIREKQLESNWDQMQESFAEGAQLGDFWILNNAPDSQFLPNHLTAIGFYLLRARTQVKEVSNILLK